MQKWAVFHLISNTNYTLIPFVFSLIINELEEYGTIQAFWLVMKNYPHYLSRPEKEKYFAIKKAAAYGVMFLS